MTPVSSTRWTNLQDNESLQEENDMRTLFRHRWILGVLLVICGLVGVNSRRGVYAAPNAPPELTLTGPESVPATATDIDVTVMVSDAVALAAFEADLGYDPALVAVSGITAGGFLGDTSQACDPNTSRCEVALGPLAQESDISAIGGYAFGTGVAPDGSGTLAVVHLAPTGATGILTLTLSHPLAADVDATPITPTVQGTVIQITAAEVCTPLTDVALSRTPTGTLQMDTSVRFRTDLMPNDATKPYSYTIAYGDGSTPLTNTGSTDPLTLTHIYNTTGTHTVEIGVWNCDKLMPITDVLDVTIVRAVDFDIYLPLVLRNVD
jgi:hypothetical protein